MYVYIDGDFYKQEDAKISVFDRTVLYGDAVFDTYTVRNGKIFKMHGHTDRLYRSAHSMAISIPISKEAFNEAVKETVRRCELRNAYVRPIVSRGLGPKPLLDPRGCKPSIIIMASPYVEPLDPEKMKKGLRCKISSIPRIPDQCLDSKIKCCNYINLIMMRMEAVNSGADDAIALTLDGFVAEVPGSNLFVVTDGKIFTPSENILLGITRETVMELAGEIGIEVRQARMTKYDVYVAEEVFLSSTAGGIIPVTEVDSRVIGSGQPGAITQRIQAGYTRMLDEGIHGTSID
jgi:branched-chain amino acid aminotransferase